MQDFFFILSSSFLLSLILTFCIMFMYDIEDDFVVGKEDIHNIKYL